ncbi:Uncharacterised protein [Aerococcus viridans]|nr:Uncharacterised protein [Aerococcus viridans]
MADIQTLVDQVLANAEKEEKEALKAFEAEMNEEINKAKAQNDAQIVAEKQHIKNAEAKKLQTQKQSYLNVLRNDKLQAKQALLEKVYNQAIVELQQLSSEEFTGFIKNALNQVAGTENLTLTVGEFSQHQFDADQVKALNPSIQLDDTFLAKRSGFILSNEEVDYNFTFESIIDQKKKALAPKLVKQAF